MKNNFTSSKKPKIGFVALLLFFCVLWGNGAMGQNVNFFWGGGVSNSWGTAGNWTRTGRYIHTANFASGDTTVTIVTPNLQGAAPSTVLAVGDAIVGPGIPVGTTVTAFSATPGAGTTITLSQPTDAAGSASIIQTYLKSTTTPYNGTSPNTATVVIDNAVLTSPLVSTTNAVANIVLLRNNFGPITGPTLTIDTGGVLTVTNVSVTPFSTAGGNIVNNGTLSITSTSTAASTGISCIVPTVLPLSPTEYSYSGAGNLNINISASTTANSAAINVSSLNANTTYKMLLNSATTTFTLGGSTATSFAFRTTGGALSSSLIIGGTGISIPTTNGGLLSLGNQSTVTVNLGTTLTFNSASTNLTLGITSFSGSSIATTLNNKGTINILGSSTRSGMNFSVAAGANIPFNINNEGILNVNLNCSGVGNAALSTSNGGGVGTGTTAVNINNAATGILTLKNSSTATGTGSAIYGSFAGEAPPIKITNDGTINFEGSTNNSGSKTTIVNNGIINSNSDFISFSSITNNVSGTFNFVKTAATATNKQVTFIVASTALASASATYTDDNSNTHVIINQKFSFALPNPLITNALSGSNIPAAGNLTKVTGTGDATIAYTSFTTSSTNSAFTSAITNSGTINTDSGTNLSLISGLLDASTGTIAPGGSGYGIIDLNKSTTTPDGILKIQVAGNSAAGVDYDQLTNSFTGNTLTLTSLDLNIAFLYTPTSNVSIPIVTVTGVGSTIAVGSFANVTGLTPGWALNQTATAVTLDYTTGSATATTWNGAVDTSWTTAGNWSAGVPNLSSNVTIADVTNDPVIGNNVNILSLTIDPAASLTVNTGFNLSVIDAITNNGSLTMANNANLIQVNNATNTGNITVNRNSNLLSRLDYTSWSSPVTNASQFLTTFSPATDLNRFYNYDETINLYSEIASPAAIPFAAGTGYLIRMPNDHPTSPTIWNGSFSGVPNNGTINKAITYNGSTFGYNMVGNPYPSTIDAQAFITANTANIESSLYFWRKINAATGSAYAVYNPMGSTTSTPSSALPNGTIQVGQGFFVKAKSASSVNFTNAMRVANNSNQFFKTKQVASKDRVWLNLTNTSGVFSQALIGYTADATTGVDMYDAKYINDSPIALTSSINSDEYTIQGRPAFDATDVVMLNFKTNAAGDYTIAIDQADGVFAAGQDVYLLDSKTGTETNLKTGSYTFAATAGVDNSRFSLKYQKTLSIDTQSFDDNSITVYADNGTLYVNSKSAAINNVTVFDVQGRIIAHKVNVKSTTAVINNLRASSQVLIVKIEGEDNSVVTKKLLN